jgi:type IV pilus assembly protein PilA
MSPVTDAPGRLNGQVPLSAPPRLARTGTPRALSTGAEGFTLLEVIFVSALIAVLSAIAIPSILRGRTAANETATIGTIRSLHTSQLTYSLTCGFGLYAASLPTLGGPTGSEFITRDMTTSPTPLKSGYRFTLQAGPGGLTGLTDCNGEALSVDYYVTAEPASVGTTGNRGFASNQAHVIWQDSTGLPPAEPFAAAATIAPIQ